MFQRKNLSWSAAFVWIVWVIISTADDAKVLNWKRNVGSYCAGEGKNRQFKAKVLFRKCHLDGHTLSFHLQTQNSEPHNYASIQWWFCYYYFFFAFLLYTSSKTIEISPYLGPAVSRKQKCFSNSTTSWLNNLAWSVESRFVSTNMKRK